MRDDFAIFILTHGRPEKIITLNTLKACGYTGKWYLILDNEDKTINKHIEMFGKEHIIVFDKETISKTFDICDNFEGRNVIVYARNACWDIARKLGLKYFAEFEDDYTSFLFRFEHNDQLASSSVCNFNNLCEIMIDFLNQSKIRTIAFAQGGDMIGGLNSSSFKKKFKRKAMNTFFFKVPENPVDDLIFTGRMNDDVNAYITKGMIGEVFLQTHLVIMTQRQTQKVSGGNTEVYKKYGTYIKSFYSVMQAPSCIKIAVMGETMPRIHHKVNYEKAVPKILRANS